MLVEDPQFRKISYIFVLNNTYQFIAKLGSSGMNRHKIRTVPYGKKVDVERETAYVILPNSGDGH
jgi:hypothetical protein